MSRRAAAEKHHLPRPTLPRCLALVAAVWLVSDLGYYFLLPALGQKANYNDGPIATSLYYVFWCGIAVITFWPAYASWPRHAMWATFENRLTSIVVWSLAFAAAVLFATYVLPVLPHLDWRESWTPPELPLASPWYFLPKSIEILFQQLLVVALVLAMAEERYDLRRISLTCAALFGAVHLLLAFGDVPWGYVVRFALLATAFGFVFPYLILRVPNGFAYSYVVHWGYYAASIIMVRIVGAGTIIEFMKQLGGGS